MDVLLDINTWKTVLALVLMFAIPFLFFFVVDMFNKTIGPKIWDACFGKGNWK